MPVGGSPAAWGRGVSEAKCVVVKETRPRRLDVRGWLGADCELEGECERLVGHDVVAEEPVGLGGHPSYVLDQIGGSRRPATAKSTPRATANGVVVVMFRHRFRTRPIDEHNRTRFLSALMEVSVYPDMHRQLAHPVAADVGRRRPVGSTSSS
jgi:hypothetical protein